MATKKSKIKAAAAAAPQTRDDCAADIKTIGDLQRQLQRTTTTMNDEIAAIVALYQPSCDEINAKVKRLAAGVQVYCEANRSDLTDNGRVKFANLITGTVTWRNRPASVKLTKVDAVIKCLKAMGLGKFVREKPEVDKEAILALHAAAKTASPDKPDGIEALMESDKLKSVSGIEIVTGLEDFAIEPFEAEVTA